MTLLEANLKPSDLQLRNFGVGNALVLPPATFLEESTNSTGTITAVAGIALAIVA